MNRSRKERTDIRETREPQDDQGPRGTYRPEADREDGRATNIPLLPIYLREMGATPLLTPAEEVEIARELFDARIAFAKRVLELPAPCKRYGLNGDLKGPRRGAEWPLDELEACYDRLVVFEKEQVDMKTLPALRDLRRDKARVDQARDKLILANLRLVTHIAKKYSNQGIAFMDLIQEGNIGLMKAVEKFEYKRGYRFSTYAYWWIKQAVTRAIADKGRLIRIPVHVTEKLKKIQRVAASLHETLGRRPTALEIARKMRIPVQQVDEIIDIVQDPQSLEAVAGDDVSNGMLPFVADPNAEDPVERTMDRELREKMHAALEALDSREEEIIRLRFGIGHDECHTLEAIGKQVKLSRERVRQIEAVALKKILMTQDTIELRRHLIA